MQIIRHVYIELLNDLYSMMEPVYFPDLNTVKQICKTTYDKAMNIQKTIGRSGPEGEKALAELQKETTKVIPKERRWTEAVRVAEGNGGEVKARAADMDVLNLVTMQAIDGAYVKSVQPYKEFLGTENDEYLRAMESYRGQVVKILTEQQADLENVTFDTATAGERARKMIIARAWFTLSYFPGIRVPMPILTTSVIEDIQGTLEPYENAIKEVSKSHVLRWSDIRLHLGARRSVWIDHTWASAEVCGVFTLGRAPKCDDFQKHTHFQSVVVF